MPHLAPLDLAIVVAYILGMTLLGVWFTRAQKDLRTYFVGGRNVGWGMVLRSFCARVNHTPRSVIPRMYATTMARSSGAR